MNPKSLPPSPDAPRPLTAEAVLAALSKFGRHVRGCSVLMPTDSAHCSCGLDAALSDLRSRVALRSASTDPELAAALDKLETAIDGWVTAGNRLRDVRAALDARLSETPR